MTVTSTIIEVVRRCGELQRIQQANRREASRVRMQHKKVGDDDVYTFEIIKGPALRNLLPKELAVLDGAREVIKRRLAQFQAQIGFYARANGLESTFRMFYHYGNERTGQFRGGSAASSAAPNIESTSLNYFERKYFETFDDGRSVWTVPSNWKKGNR